MFRIICCIGQPLFASLPDKHLQVNTRLHFFWIFKQYQRVRQTKFIFLGHPWEDFIPERTCQPSFCLSSKFLHNFSQHLALLLYSFFSWADFCCVSSLAALAFHFPYYLQSQWKKNVSFPKIPSKSHTFISWPAFGYVPVHNTRQQSKGWNRSISLSWDSYLSLGDGKQMNCIQATKIESEVGVVS